MLFTFAGTAAAQEPTSKKGVGTWYFDANNAGPHEDINASWFYNWNTEYWVTVPAACEFVPMIWGKDNVTATEFQNAIDNGNGTLLGFNEPDVTSQSSMTPQQALAAWPQFIATGLRLGSPAPATDALDEGGWLDTFMDGANANGYRVDFICLHWYGGQNWNYNVDQNVQMLKAYLQGSYNKYGKPIWLTEFAMINWTQWPTINYPSWEVQTEFVTKSVEMLESLDFVERYAWYALPGVDWAPNATNFFYYDNGDITLPGIAYRAAGLETAPPPGYARLRLQNPGGGTTIPAAGDHDYPIGTEVTIYATANSGYYFGSFQGDLFRNPIGRLTTYSYTVTMDGNKEISAMFSRTPRPISFSATSGSRGGSDTFVGIFRDPDGWQDLDKMTLWIDGAPGGYSGDIAFQYFRSTNTIRFFDDHGVPQAPIAVNAGAPVVSNSQGSIDISGITTSGSGTDFTITVPITFASGWNGDKALRIYCEDLSLVESNGGANTQLGTYTVDTTSGSSKTTTWTIAANGTVTRQTTETGGSPSPIGAGGGGGGSGGGCTLADSRWSHIHWILPALLLIGVSRRRRIIERH
jgi:hypothetical protein